MKRNKFLPGLLIMLGLLALLIPTALAQGPSYQVFYDYDEELCSFELYCSGDLLQNGDSVTNPGLDAAFTENEVPLWFMITDIEEGYRIKEVLVNGVEIPYCTEGFYGEGSYRITRDSLFQVILEEIPDTLPGIARVEFYAMDEYSGDWSCADAVMFEHGVCERLWAKVYTTDGYATSYQSPESYPDFLFAYEWEYSTDGTNWTPIYNETRNEIYAPFAGAAPDYYEGYFMDLRNYYLRAKIHGDERHFANADIYSAPIPVNNPNAMSQGYKLTLNYDPSLGNLRAFAFPDPMEPGYEVQEDDWIAPGSQVSIELSGVKQGARIRDCRVNGESYDPLNGVNYMSDFWMFESILLNMNRDMVVDLILETDFTVSTVQSATISTVDNEIPLSHITLAPYMQFLDVDVTYEGGVDDPDYYPLCRWQYSTDGQNWVDLPNDNFNDRLYLDPYWQGVDLFNMKNYYLRAALSGRTNYCMTANGSYIYTDPILVNPTQTPKPPAGEPANGYKLTFIYDDTMCDFSVYDWYTDIPVQNGGILPINETDNRAYGVMEIENIKEGYRIKDFLINGISYADMMIDGGYGGGAVTISRDSTLEVVLEPIPDQLAVISSASVHLTANDDTPISEVTFVPGELERLYASVKFSDESANYPDYFSTCLWEYSTDDGATWTEAPGWGRSSQFYAAWSLFTERYNIDFMTMQNYYLRVCVSPKNHYSTTPNGGYLYSAPILVNCSVPRYTVTCDVNGGEALENNRLVTNTKGKLPSLPIPRWLGYRFDGWFTDSATGSEVTSETVFEQDSTIYAHWTTAHPMSSAQVCPDYQSTCEVEIIQDGAELSVVVDKGDTEEDLSRFSSWVASYDENGRMTGLQFLTGIITDEGIRFEGTVNGAGDKLFLLGGEMIPVIEACVSE